MTAQTTPVKAGPAVGMISLGCPKNLVDSERIMGRLAAGGFVPTSDPEQAEVLIVNTCGFIGPAKQESIDTLLEMAEYKQTGRLRYLVSTGCLVQRYASQLVPELPEVDAWLGVNDYDNIDRFLWDLYGGRIEGVPVRVSDPGAVIAIEQARLRLTPSHYAYLRLSEGCDKTCTFCSIPAIRGGFRSKPADALVAEARELVESGARELNLISQDTLHYGVDTDGRRSIAPLLERLCEIDDLAWLRLWYLYPGGLPKGLLDQIVDQPKIVPYLDMPIQHAVPEVLRAMRRPFDVEAMRAQVIELRERIPGVVLRTSVIVGFPGETEAHFDEMVGFVSEHAFERLGVFVYSQEDGTPAAELPDQVDEDVKQSRYERMTGVSRQILEAAQSARVGGIETALVDGPSGYVPGHLAARTTAEGPDVDPVVLLPEGAAPTGAFVEVEMTGLRGLDMVGRPVA